MRTGSFCSTECRDNWYRLDYGRYRDMFPCLSCNKFVCQFGQARCELCEFGHTAEWCPERIDVTTMLSNKPKYVHGRCKGKTGMAKSAPKDAPTVFTWESAGTRYTVKGVVNSLDCSTSGGIRIEMIGTVTSEVIHASVHFAEIGRHDGLCVCECRNCLGIDGNCICQECKHGKEE